MRLKETGARRSRAHGKVLESMVPVLGPQTVLDSILKRERWHGRGGSWVADAIYGVNDGLGSVFGIVSGVAGATNNQQHYVLISAAPIPRLAFRCSQSLSVARSRPLGGTRWASPEEFFSFIRYLLRRGHTSAPGAVL